MNTLPLESNSAHPILVYGAPMTEMPRDLYIPPEALEIYLEAFEGPLDLLLYLIRKANVNILDIPMAQLTAQYLEYVDKLRHRRLEMAGEYLLMAAMLLDIKARMLLPQPPEPETLEEADPRAELVRRLLMYERMREAALRLNRLPQAQRDFDWVQVESPPVQVSPPTVSVQDIISTWMALIGRAKLVAHHKVKRVILSVREHMGLILRRLTTDEPQNFATLWFGSGVPLLIVTFLAVLELTKEGLVDASQNGGRDPIYVKRLTVQGKQILP